MFGYLVASAQQMTEEQQLRYRRCYCGLCRRIGERCGQPARLTLAYDMTFLVLLLGSLYEPAETEGEGRCPPHPVEGRPWWYSEATDYAADMNVALAYLKCLDDWQDDANPIALAEAGLLKGAYETVCRTYPRQCRGIENSLEKLHRMEKARCEDADAAAASFGELMGEVLVWREDRWSETLRAFGHALGRFLYVMDACMDLEGDAFHNRYNPFRRYYGLTDNEQRFRDILKMILGECMFHFDRLPLVQDLGILQNILCAGLWTQFDGKYSKSKEPTDGSGSV